MSFHADKKREHEEAAEKALASGDYAKAFFHTGKAADYGLNLAEQSEGKIRKAYLDDATELMKIAQELKKKAEQKKPGQAQKAVKEETDKEKAAGADWLVTEKPKVRLSDIAGMATVKNKLAEMVIEPLKHAEQAKEWGVTAGGGILLYGPPGNGKTTLGKAVAGELDAAFFYATGAELRSKWHGESEKRLRELLQAARAQPVSVLFLDDMDGLLPKRGGDSVVDNRIVVQFLAEVGGFEESENVLLLLGATNKPWGIDEAVFRTGRFDEKIFVDLPDKPAIEFILKKHLGGAPLAPDIDVSKIADELDGYSGSDVVAIAQSAKRAGFRRAISGGSNQLSADDIRTAMKTIPSSATPKMMKQYADFAQARFK